MSELATLAYVPTRGSLHPQAFLDNLAAFKTRYPVIFYSDGQVGGCSNRMPQAEVLKGHRNKVAINNFIFLHGLQVAMEHGLKRFIFLETDVRICGDAWDGVIMDEAGQHKDIVCAGTPCVWNASEMPNVLRFEVNNYVSAYRKASGFALPTFHSKTKEFQTRPGNHCLFIMGAGAVYDVGAMERIFHKGLANPMEYACQIQAFDLHIGLWCNRVYGTDSVSKLPWLKCIWSGYHEKVYSKEQRADFLKSGKVVLAHQFKTSEPMIFSNENVTTHAVR